MSHVESTTVAEHIIAGLINAGVEHIVVSPGSRSQALALAAAQAEQLDAVKLHVAIDERSAGFFALGVAHETGIPAAVIATSGTAVGNLLPAVLEAHEGRVPLVLITADRPAELQGIRANQATVKQAHIFQDIVRVSTDMPLASDKIKYIDGVRLTAIEAVSDALGDGRAAGPVHLNIAFKEPLSGGDSVLKDLLKDESPIMLSGVIDRLFQLESGENTVVIAGAQAANAAEFAEKTGLPLCAEVVSGARHCAALVNYAQLIQEFGAQIRRAIVFGHPTLGREISALLRQKNVETIVVDACADKDTPAYNPGRSAIVVDGIEIHSKYCQPAEWTAKWRARDVEISAVKHRETTQDSRFAAVKHCETTQDTPADFANTCETSVLTRESLVSAVWETSRQNDTLVLAASRLVRVLDRVATPRQTQVVANRGLAGIDGTIATALGVAQAKEQGKTRLLIGDLAFLHDVGSLLLSPLETKPNLHIIVGNDLGGTIFDSLEVRETADAAAFVRVQTTPHTVDISQLAGAYGWAYNRAETTAELKGILQQTGDVPMITEVRLDAR